MMDPIYRIGRTDPTRQDAERTADNAQTARQSKFGALMYAMLKPPTLDFADANGDDDEGTRPPMKAHVQPNLAKLMKQIEGGTSAQPAPAQASTRDVKQSG